jgi:hypothetical protein
MGKGRMSLPQVVEGTRIEWHLGNWASWMRGAGRPNLWYPSRASGGMGKSGSSDFDSMVASADSHCAAAVDAIVDGLTPRERCAVHNRHLATVFIVRDEEGAYLAALVVIERGLAAKGIW